MDTTTQTTTQPVTVTVTVTASPGRAFEIFTERFYSWWPTSHHIGANDPADIVIEPRTGGRWFERGLDGLECDWGTVLAWEPPHRLVLSWHLNGQWAYEPDPALASEVELRFVEESPTLTRVTLTHGKLDRHGPDATRIRTGVSGEGGWPSIMNRYSGAVVDES